MRETLPDPQGPRSEKDGRRLRFACASAVCFITMMLCSCAPQHTPWADNGRRVAEHEIIYPEDMDSISRSRISQIRIGLTFEEVTRIIPIYTNGLQNVEHGGTWYHAPAGTNWILLLRFENPSTEPDLLKRKLNYPPEIRARVPNEASW